MAWTAGVFLAAALIVALIAAASGKSATAAKAATRAAQATDCQKISSKPGYWNGYCVIDSPQSFHVSGYATDTYRMTWELDFYGATPSSSGQGKLDPAATTPFAPKSVLVAGSFGKTVNPRHYFAQYQKMLKAKTCRLVVTFQRVRPGARLLGLITVNQIHWIHFDA